MLSDVYRLGDISDEESNELIFSLCKSLHSTLTNREIVESKIFPVNHYIHVACYILYDQSYQYNILKKIASYIAPEEIARRSKFLGSPLNQLGFCAISMLYLHGRAQIIYDNLNRKMQGGTNIIVEPEKKKKETKFILDFWRRMSPNYLNDGALTIDNNRITFLSDDYIQNLRDQMIPIGDDKGISKKLKETIAQLTILNFISAGECRTGIFEHGPYYFEGSSEPLIFKEFNIHQASRNDSIMTDSGIIPHELTTSLPIQRLIFGMTLKDMNKLEFNNFGTLIADPSEFSSNITSLGIWTREPIHPKDLRYPDKMGILKNLSPKILDELNEFAKNGTKELYIKFSKWSYIKKLMLGVGIYANSALSSLAAYAGLENEFNWTWALDYAEDKPLKVDLDKEKIKWYIDSLEKTPAHPFISRIFRSWRKQKDDPFYYFLQD
jgi:hypothetical protein